MFAKLRAQQPGASLLRILWWHKLHFICYVWCRLFYRYRWEGVANVPLSGPILLVSNHQSLLDPILVGVPCWRRQFYALARSTLWKHWWLAWLINSLNAIPVERDSADTKAMRRCLEVLAQGHALLIFPEGTRTPDGTTKAFATGTMLLIRRARPTIIPVAIDGAFAAWPRERKRPYLTGRIGASFGKPIAAEELIAMGPEAGMEHLRQTVEALRLEVHGRLIVGGGVPRPAKRTK